MGFGGVSYKCAGQMVGRRTIEESSQSDEKNIWRYSVYELYQEDPEYLVIVIGRAEYDLVVARKR